jgi:hypothetical protein
VVSERPASLNDGCHTEALQTPAQASARFQIPEYLLRKACFEGRLEHLRVVNAIWQLLGRIPSSRSTGRGVDVYGAFPSLHVAYPLIAMWGRIQRTCAGRAFRPSRSSCSCA